MGAAIAHVIHDEAATGALPCPASASVAHLNVNGTAMVASLATSRSAIATRMRSLRSRRSVGQMYGHNPISVGMSLACLSEDTSRFNARVDRKEPSVISRPEMRRAAIWGRRSLLI